MINKKVIVRGDRSGVFFGTLAEREGMEVKLVNCRRLWYWEGAASISQIAMEGVKKPREYITTTEKSFPSALRPWARMQLFFRKSFT